MSKVKCGDCGKTAEWYKSAIHEIAYEKIDKKVYCDECIKKIGHKAVDLV